MGVREASKGKAVSPDIIMEFTPTLCRDRMARFSLCHSEVLMGCMTERGRLVPPFIMKEDEGGSVSVRDPGLGRAPAMFMLIPATPAFREYAEEEGTEEEGKAEEEGGREERGRELAKSERTSRVPYEEEVAAGSCEYEEERVEDDDDDEESVWENAGVGAEEW